MPIPQPSPTHLQQRRIRLSWLLRKPSRTATLPRPQRRLSPQTQAVTQDTTDLANATAASNAADAAVTTAQNAALAAQAVVDAAQGVYDAALAANLPFAQTLGAYNNALAANLDLHTAAASTAVAALVISLGNAGICLIAGDLDAVDAAIAAAQIASNAAAAAVTALQGGPNVVA